VHQVGTKRLSTEKQFAEFVSGKEPVAPEGTQPVSNTTLQITLSGPPTGAVQQQMSSEKSAKYTPTLLWQTDADSPILQRKTHTYTHTHTHTTNCI